METLILSTLGTLVLIQLALLSFLVHKTNSLTSQVFSLSNKIIQHDKIFRVVAEDSGYNYNQIREIIKTLDTNLSIRIKILERLDIYEKGLYDVMKELETPKR